MNRTLKDVALPMIHEQAGMVGLQVAQIIYPKLKFYFFRAQKSLHMRSGIDESINLLKELEFKLKNQQNKAAPPPCRTQEDAPEVKENRRPWGDRLITGFEAENCSLEEQNRKLKKYVNRLLKMNDYLKNQLVKRDFYNKKYKDPTVNPETEFLKMEIEYLQEVNREKDLKIQLYERRLKNHGRVNSQLEQVSTQELQIRNRHSTKCLPESKLTNSKSTMRKQSQLDMLRRKSSKKRKESRCPLCY